MSASESEQQVPMFPVSAAELKTLLEFAASFNPADLPPIHDAETTEFLPITNGNGETCEHLDEIISDNELNISLSPLKQSDFCDVAPSTTKQQQEQRCKSCDPSFCPSSSSAALYCRQTANFFLRRTRSLSNLNALKEAEIFVRKQFPRRSPTTNFFKQQQFHVDFRGGGGHVASVETVDVLGYKLPLVSGPPASTENYVCVSDVYQTFFSRRHWDEFKEILTKNGINPVFGVVKNACGRMDDVNAITVHQCESLLLNNQARKDGFVRCIRLDGSLDDASASTSANSAAVATPSETKLIFAAERQVGELSSGIKTRHADQSDILYVEYDGKTLPSITVNERQFVRLVDVQKNILTPDLPAVLSKNVSVLKNVCTNADVVVTKCRPNEKARLVVYANSYRSNSLHVIAAEDLPRLMAFYKQYENRRNSSVKRKYVKRSRTLDDDAPPDVGGLDDFDYATFKRLRDNASSSMNDFNSNFSSFSTGRRHTYWGADSSEPSPLSRPSSVSTDTASCSGDSVSMLTPGRSKQQQPPLSPRSATMTTGPSTFFSTDSKSSLTKSRSKTNLPPSLVGNNGRYAATTSAALFGGQQQNHIVGGGSNSVKPTSSRKLASSFEQMLASADDFYKINPKPIKPKTKFDNNVVNNNNNNSLNGQTAMSSIERPTKKWKNDNRRHSLDVGIGGRGRKLSKLLQRTTSKIDSNSNSRTTSSSTFFDNNFINTTFVNLQKSHQQQSSSSSSKAGRITSSPTPPLSSSAAVVGLNDLAPYISQTSSSSRKRGGSANFSSSSFHQRDQQQQLSPSSSPPPVILPEISYRVDTREDFDLGRNETLLTDLLISTLTRPCLVYVGKSAPLPVAVYNRRFQRGPAGYYYDHLFVGRQSECIHCCTCKQFMSLKHFVQHAHNATPDGGGRLIDPLLFMFVRNPTTDRFDLWRNLCAKAKTFGVQKLVNYNLPDDLAEYYEERRYNNNNNNVVVKNNHNNNVNVNVNNNNSSSVNNNLNDELNQREVRSTAAILLSLSRGK